MAKGSDPKASVANRQEIHFEEHRLSPEECFEKHDVDPNRGLSTTQVGVRTASHRLAISVCLFAMHSSTSSLV